MADDETSKPETAASQGAAKTRGRKPAATKSTPAKKPATAKKTTATPTRKPATPAKKPATAKKPARTKTAASAKPATRWAAIAGGAIAAIAAAGAAVFALRKPKAVEALVDTVQETTGIGTAAALGSGKPDAKT